MFLRKDVAHLKHDEVDDNSTMLGGHYKLSHGAKQRMATEID
jgi:hypothetical protein